MTAAVYGLDELLEGAGLLRGRRRVAARRREMRFDGLALFLGATVLYLVVGALLAFHFHLFETDAQSRAASASYVLFSRDPKLAAIGFVWVPLPTLAMLPFVAMRSIWEPFVTQGFAAITVSALAMAGSAVQLLRMFEEQRVRRAVRWPLVILFAINPIIVIFGANGMTEALYIFVMLSATRYLCRWTQHRATGDLTLVGICLAAAYLTRYESAAATFAIMAVVAFLSWRTGRGMARRAWSAATDAVLVGFIPLSAMVSFALVSWAIVGSPAEHFTSIYGNDTQTSIALREEASTSGLRVEQLIRQVMVMAPALLLVLGLVIVIGAWRRSPLTGVAVLVLGVPVAATSLTSVLGITQSNFRFIITTLPLAILFAGAACVDPLDEPPGGHRGAARTRRRRALDIVAVGAIAVCTVTALVCVPVNSENATLNFGVLGIIGGDRNVETNAWTQWDGVARIVRRLDAPRGSVLIDTFTGFGAVMRSSHPDQYVITSDDDFGAAVRDPLRFGVRYLVVPEPVDLAAVDALNRAYPHLYKTGAGIADQIGQVVSPSGRAVRVFRVRQPASAADRPTTKAARPHAQ